ncbi:MAG: ABC transporter permease [Myxococcaceae bacterium]|nr:ABC transporter permease [Myxococcaceae bacterium]
MIGTIAMIALRNVTQHSRRSALVGGAVAVVSALLTLASGLLASTEARIRDSAVAIFSGELNVHGLYKPSASRVEPVLLQSEAIAQEIKAVVPEATLVPRWVGLGTVSSPASAARDLIIMGLRVESEPRLKKALRLVSGTLADLGQPGAIVISEEWAKKLKVSVGDQVVMTGINHRRAYNAVDATVVGVAHNVPGGLLSFVVLASETTVRELYGFGPDQISSWQVQLPEDADLGGLQERLHRTLESETRRGQEPLEEPWPWKKLRLEGESWVGSRLEVTRWDQEVALQAQNLRMIDALVRLVGAVLLLFAAGGLMNTLWLAVRERTQEIGTLRAIGMGRGSVVMMFVFEAFLLSLLGAVLGAVLGEAIGEGIGHAGVAVPEGLRLMMGSSDSLGFAFAPRATLSALLSVAVATTLPSFFPALLASRIPPVVAMSKD